MGTHTVRYWVDVVVGALIFSVAKEAMSSVENEKGRRCRRSEKVQNSHPGQQSGAKGNFPKDSQYG